MPDPFRIQAKRAIAFVIEAGCPLFKVELRIHDERAGCPCSGDAYKASPGRLEVGPCPELGRRC